MNAQEKRLYHQIHPLKLGTDISAEIISLILFWRHKLVAGLLVEVVPPIIASFVVMKWANLEPYKQSAFGRYIHTYMTPLVVIIRVIGTIATHVGAWYRRPSLIPAGLAVVLVGWLRGVLVPRK